MRRSALVLVTAVAAALVPLGVASADALAPSVSILSPSAGATFNARTTPTGPFLVSATVSATDADGIASVQLLDGGAVVASDSAAPFELSFTTTVRGQHTLVARAFDTTTAQADSAPVNVLVDTPVATARAFNDNGAFMVSFSRPVTGIDEGSITLRLRDTKRAVDATLFCNGDSFECDPAAPDTSAFLVTEDWRPGERYEIVLAPGIADADDLPASPSVIQVRGATSVDELNDVVASPWVRTVSTASYGASFHASRTAGAALTFSYTGRDVVWYTTQGPEMGRAEVFVDGLKVAVVNNGASTRRFRVPVFRHRSTGGSHTIGIRVLGDGGRAGAPSLVVVDAFAVDGRLQASPAVQSLWALGRAGAANAGAFLQESTTGATTTFRFRGTSVTWWTVLAPNQGVAEVYLDGRLLGSANNYSPITRWGTKRRFTMADGQHTLVIKVAGKRSAASKGSAVVVDRFDVG